MTSFATPALPPFSAPVHPALAGEPTLAELLDDPVTQILMARDGVKREALLALAVTFRTGLAS